MDQRKIILYIAISLDGFIAKSDDSLDWLLNVEGENDNGFNEFYDSIDTIIMGRRTYDWIINHENRFPYIGKECYVYSKTKKDKNEYVEFTNQNVNDLVNSIGNKRIWIVGGSQIIKLFQDNNLIDQYIINIAPIILCEGIPLFEKKELFNELNLKLINVRRFNQFVELNYKKRL